MTEVKHTPTPEEIWLTYETSWETDNGVIVQRFGATNIEKKGSPKYIRAGADTASSLIPKLNDIWRDADHERGCRGREYNCSCGFDERTYATARLAADEISRLTEELARTKRNRDMLREAMREISGSDDIDNALDPERNKRLARAALSKPEGGDA